jgi:hypothetical protein
MTDAFYMLIIIVMLGVFVYWFHINKCELCIEYHRTHSSHSTHKKRKRKKSSMKKKVSFPEEIESNDSIDL